MAARPKRTEELQRPRERRGSASRDPITYGQLAPLDEEFCEPDPRWHAVALMVWDAAMSSGQKAYYQNSDLAMLWHACDELSEYKRSPRKSAMIHDSIMRVLDDLLLTEGTRRKARLELQKPKAEEAGLDMIASELYGDLFPDAEARELLGLG